MPNIQQLIKALRRENLEPKIEDEKVCNNTLNVLTFSEMGVQIWLNDKADIEYCWDNGIMVGGANGGIKTDKLSSTIKFITEYIKKYHPTIEIDVPLKENSLNKILEQYEKTLKTEEKLGKFTEQILPQHIKEKIDKYNHLTTNKIDSGIFKAYILEYRKINEESNIASDNLNKFPKTEMGLFSNETRALNDFQKADLEYKRAFKKLQDFNKSNKELSKYYNKHFPYVLMEKLDLDLIEPSNEKTTQEETETQKSKTNRQR